VQARRGEHRHERTVGDLQVLDKVKAVEFGTLGGHLRQIPALRRGRTALSMGGIQRTMANENAVDRRARRHLSQRIVLAQRRADCFGPIFAQNAVLAQMGARAQNAPLDLGSGAIPRAPRLAVCEAHPVKALAARPPDPIGQRPKADPEALGHFSQTASCAHRLHHLAAAFLKGAFLPMTKPSKIRARYPNPQSSNRTHVAARGHLRSPSGLPTTPPRIFRLPLQVFQ
jgi:hypothetical protein